MVSEMLETIEERLTTLEKESAPLKRQVQAGEHEGTPGLFANEPEMVDEMLAMIRTERDKSALPQAHILLVSQVNSQSSK